MLYTEKKEFLSALTYSKIGCFDVGRTKIGIATGDIKMKMAVPSNTLMRTMLEEDLATIFIDYDQDRWGGIIVGLPLEEDGSEGRRCQSIRQFVRDLLKYRDVPVFLMDERFTTVKAKELLEDAGSKQKEEVHDAVAAQVILNDFLSTIP